MPSFFWSDTLAINQIGQNPIVGWQYERVPSSFMAGAYIVVLQRATALGVRQSIFSGSQNILQRSPVQAGGVAGVTPTPLNTPTVDWRGSPDDLLQVLNDETIAGTPVVDGIITIEPL